MKPPGHSDVNDLQANFEDFFETTLCGFIIADPQGSILRANTTIAAWTSYSAHELKGKRFSDLLTIGGKIYYETHLWPLLRMQGFFDEVVLELAGNTGQKIRVMVNAFERRDAAGRPHFIRYTVLKASDRLQYEQNLLQAKKIAEHELARQKEIATLREQLIAVLGHDLRNPLFAITMAIQVLETSLGAENADLIAILKRSTFRMKELVTSITDFARSRLGEGIVLNRQNTLLNPVLEQVVAEMRLVYPAREIDTEFDVARPVVCDPHRIAQLLSNLLGNALTHGDANSPVLVRASREDETFQISVCNKGVPIPPDLQARLFTPFVRNESRPSQHGLGLGLYICAEIARAHHASLTFTSNEERTCFTFRMNVDPPAARVPPGSNIDAGTGPHNAG